MPNPWAIVYFKTPDGEVPAADFLEACPNKVEAKLLAVLIAVAKAPPPQFSGGGLWEAMHGDMAGYHEIRTQGPNREQFRLFCRLENGTEDELSARGFAGPAIAVIGGLRKPWMTKFSHNDYQRVRDLGSAYLNQLPRSIAT